MAADLALPALLQRKIHLATVNAPQNQWNRFGGGRIET
jgi:hypothetical protein